MRPISPYLAIQQIQDIYIRDNFKALLSYFSTQNQLLDFKFFEQVFDGEADEVQIAHALGYIPKDILVTRITGDGVVTFNYSKFTTTTLSLSATGACRVRFFAGTYWNDVSVETAGSADAASVSSSSNSAVSSESSSNSLPTGTILEFGGTVLPTGFLWCDGKSYSRTVYENLFLTLGTSFGSTDSSSFNVPDKRGVVSRGWNSMGGVASGIDPDASTRTALKTGGNAGDAVGSYQADTFQGHGHHLVGSGTASPGNNGVGATTTTDTLADIQMDTRLYQVGALGVPRSSTETRMKNIYVGYIIKY